MPESWQCGHCDLIVELPDEVERPDLYHTSIAFIRDHRFCHIADRIMNADTDEDIMALADEELEPDPTSLLHGEPVEFNGRHYVTFPADLPRIDGDTGTRSVGPDFTPVTGDDAAPAVDEAEAIVRRRQA